MRKPIAVAAVTGTVAALIAAAPVGAVLAAPRPAASAAGSIKWGSCSDPALQGAHAQCGFLSVPLDYRFPQGKQIKIAVSRIAHTAKRYQGVLLSNPGGPGGSGLNLNAFLAGAIPLQGAAGYDLIGFDPRGVGSSVPALRCEANYLGYARPSFIPRTVRLLSIWLKRSKTYAAGCTKGAGAELLSHLTTADSARDMDRIRIALHQSQISYFGYSYGTYLGQVYSTMFPTRVRRLIMDSNVDPRRVWYQANLDQDVAFDRNIKIWFGWLARYNSTYHLGRTGKAVQSLFNAEEAQLARHPALGKIGADEWIDIFLQAGYYQFTWPQTGSAFAGWVHKHDGATLKLLYDQANTPADDNNFAVYNGVQCTDVQWPLSWAKWAKDNWAVYKIAPFETWDNAWYNAPCLYWAGKASRPVRINGTHVRGALLIDETLDAATPYPGSLYVRSIFPHAVLLAEPGGTTHAGSLSGNACVDDTIARYLLTGGLPARRHGRGPDKLCTPLPEPQPSLLGTSPFVVRPMPPIF